MNLLDKLHDKALTTKKNHLKYPLLIASGIADWIAGTADEIKGHGEAAKGSEEDKDYKLYEEGVKGAAIGELGAYAGAVYTGSKVVGLPIGVDLLVRNINAVISGAKSLKRMREDPDSDGTIDVDLTGAIGTARTLAYKIGERFGRSDGEPEEPVDYEDMEDMPPVFSDPLPDPLKEDLSETLDEKPRYKAVPVELNTYDTVKDGQEVELNDYVLEEVLEDDELLSLDFDPEPAPEPVELPESEPEPEPEPVQLPGPDEGYSLPDIIEPEDEPDAEYLSPDIADVELAADESLDDDAPETPSSKPEIDIGPLAPSYSQAEQEDDEEGPDFGMDEDDSGNKLF